MKNLIHSLILIFLLSPLLQAQKRNLIPDSRPKQVEVTVLDTENQPIEGVYIEASRKEEGNAEATTDATGTAVLKVTAGASLYLYATKEGYYRTGGELWRAGMRKGPDGKLTPRVVPDSFTVVLKQVREPVLMRHMRFRGRAPKSPDPMGFDLKVGDWVAPLGKGVTTDLYFHFHDMFLEGNSFAGTLTISFPNKADGIQAFTAARPFSMEFGSDLAPPNLAPVEGYDPTLSFTKAHKAGEPYNSTRSRQRNYLFRTRTIVDAQGTLLQACYGWIQGEIEFDPRDQYGPQLTFAFYFNHDPDPAARSLEYNLHVPRKRD